MPQSICLAASLATRPYRHYRRKNSFIANFVLCSALRHSPSDTTSTRERVLSLIKNYEPTKKQDLKTLTPSDMTGALDLFLEWGFSLDELSNCVRVFPYLLSQDQKRMKALFHAFRFLGFSLSEFQNILIRFPRIIKCNATNVIDLNTYFCGVLEFTTEQFVQMIKRRPSTLTLSAHENIIPTCEYFVKELEMEKEQLAKALITFPQLLGCSLEAKIKPTVNYILHELHVPQEVFTKKLRRQITILGRSLETLKTRVRWLESNLGYSEDEMSKFLSLSLYAFVLSEETLQAKIKNLCFQFGIDFKECGALLRNYPQMLTISVRNVNNTIEYLTQSMGRDLEEVRKAPRVLSCSLERRIKPRYKILTMNDFPMEEYSLLTLFCCNDDDFEKLLERHLSD